jgi:methylated-DNA-[protein]-cysteine S-methyltransferase
MGSKIEGNKMIYTTYCETPLGRMLLSGDGEHLTGAWFEGQKYFADTLAADSAESSDLPLFKAAIEWFAEYFSAKRPSAGNLPLAPHGGEFRQSVWRALLDIPYGEVLTYGEIAKITGCGSAQAVGGAIGHNPISVIIPCHRVVGANGSLTGYAGGLDRKLKLLELEKADVSRLTVPTTGTAV